MLVYMGYLNWVTDVKEVYFVFKGLTKITVGEPNDFIFSELQTTNIHNVMYYFFIL